MPISQSAKQYVRGITFALLGIVAAVLGIVAVGFFSDYFTAHPALAAIAISETLGIDVFGAVIPLTMAVISAALFVKAVNFSTRRFTEAFLASVTLAFLLFHASGEGVEGYSLLYALLVGAVTVAVNVFTKRSVGYRKKYVDSVLLGLACAPLSIFVVDLFYSGSFIGSVIGGNGLADALFISTLYVPLAVTAAFSVLAYVSQTVWLVRKSRSVELMQSRPSIPVAAEDSNSPT
jgi:dolichyl-phosphate-mannose--protein O-mannosyl transferase